MRQKTITAVANGAEPAQRKAAADANVVQDACNLIAVVGCFHQQLMALHRSGVYGSDLLNHPVAIAYDAQIN